MSGTIRQGGNGDLSVGSDYGLNVARTFKPAGGKVFSFNAINANAAVRYLQLHDLVAAPVGGETPKLCFQIPLSGSLTIGSDFFMLQGTSFLTGISYAFSTTPKTYTAATPADGIVNVVFQ